MCSGESAPRSSPFKLAHSCSLGSSGFVQSATECKELQLSEDQNGAVMTGHGLSSAQDHPRHVRGKGVRMKPKVRAAPYPEVGLGVSARRRKQPDSRSYKGGTFSVACLRCSAGHQLPPVGTHDLLTSDGCVEGEIWDAQQGAGLQLGPRGRTGSDPSVPAEAAACGCSAA